MLTISILAMLFAAVQAYYSRQQHLAELAENSLSADELKEKALKTLLDASQMTLPLPRTLTTEVEKARDRIVRAKKLGADAIECRELIAFADILLLNVGDADKSLGELRRQRPELPLPYLALGISYFLQENYRKSEAVLTSGLARFPTLADLFSHRAWALLRQRRLDEARQDAERAVSLDESSALAHFVLGLVLTESDLNEEAIEAFARASRLAPGWHEPHTALASLHIQDGDLHQALRQLETAIPNARDDATAQLARAAVLNALGNEEAAADSLAATRDLLPIKYIAGFGYTGVHPWCASDLPKLDEFSGDFLLKYRDKNPGWEPEGFELPLLKALCGTSSVSKFLAFEEALFDICVDPNYHIADTSFGVAQTWRLMNRTPECLFRRRRIESVWMVENELRLPAGEVPRRPMPKIESARINAFFQQNSQ